MPGAPAVFLDRDGTLNVDHDYVHRPDQWDWIPGAVEALRGFMRLGLKVVVVTNQAGIARGLYGEDHVRRLHAWVDGQLAGTGARIDAYYFCAHHPDHGERRTCDCRKPAPGMILKAARDLGLDPARSFMVGDKLIDVQAGAAAGATPLLVRTGHGERESGRVPPGTPVVADVLEAQRWIAARLDAAPRG